MSDLGNVIRDALRKIHESDHDADEAVEKRLRDFYESVPPHLHDTAVVREMATYIQIGMPVHPSVHRRLEREYKELLESGPSGDPSSG